MRTDNSLANIGRCTYLMIRTTIMMKLIILPGWSGLSWVSNTICNCRSYDLFWSMVSEGARIEAEQGAEILFYPQRLVGRSLKEVKIWIGRKQYVENSSDCTWIANNCFVAAANRVGQQDSLIFWGSSFISDPYGRILVLGPTDAEANLIAVCDMSVIDQKKKDWPFLESRRIKYQQSK